MVVQRAGAMCVSRAEMRDAVGCCRLCRNVGPKHFKEQPAFDAGDKRKRDCHPTRVGASPDASETMQRPENT